MSYHTWHNYGYGICTSDLKKEMKVDRLIKLIKLAPQMYEELQEMMEDYSGAIGSYDILTEFVINYTGIGYGGLATILQAVIKEQEGIELYVCDDFDGNDYLIYPPIYPWQLINQNERELTEEKIATMIGKYLRIATDEVLPVEYQEVENGG